MTLALASRRAGLGLVLAALGACSADAPAPLSPRSTGPLLNTAIFQKPTKTATGYWEQDLVYDWTVAKTVSPASQAIGPGSSATFTYAITATRTETSSSNRIGVRGQICVKNLGSADSQGMTITDNVYASTNGGATWSVVATQNVDVSSNPVISPNEQGCFAYDVPFTPVAGALYRNEGTVTWTNAGNGGVGDPGTTQTWETTFVPFTLPATPATTLTDATATLADVLTCPAGFSCTPGAAYGAGTWSLTGTSVLSYGVTVRNDSAPCKHTDVVENAATLTEGDSGTTRGANATVVVSTPDCPVQTGFQGCTPGYWKQKQHFGNWTGYTPTGTSASRYNTVFGVNLFSAATTLLDALGTGGGGKYRLGRHSSAALLSAANSSVAYGMTPSQVIAAVQAAVASGNYDSASDVFEKLNERQCPLGRAP